MERHAVLALALAAQLAFATGADRAAADFDCSPSDSGSFDSPASGECEGSERISSTAATCLSATRSGTYDAQQGGYATKAGNDCADLANIVVRVERGSAGGALACVGSANYTLYTSTPSSGVACCFEGAGDLCWRNQVVADAGGSIEQAVLDGSTLSRTKVDVSTHSARYDFCRDNPDDVYCEVNPAGDAMLDPQGDGCGTGNQLACNCGDRFCNVGDCNWHYEQSAAAETCRDRHHHDDTQYRMSISAIDGSSQTCTLTVACQSHRDDGDRWVYETTTVSDEVWLFDDLNNCSGALQVGECDG